MLKADSQGFLSGDPLDLKRQVQLMTAISRDVTLIKNALLGRVSTKATRSPSVSPSFSRQRDSQGRFTRSSQPVAAVRPARSNRPGAVAVGSIQDSRQQQTASIHRRRSVSASSKATPTRDAQGRFMGAGGTSGGGYGGSFSRDVGESGIARLAGRIYSAITDVKDGAEDVDPAVKAFNEVAQPLMGGYKALMGDRSERRQEGWFKKLFNTLTGFRKDSTGYAKAANSRLKSIDEKPEEKSKGGGAWLAWLAAPLLMLGKLLLDIVAPLRILKPLLWGLTSPIRRLLTMLVASTLGKAVLGGGKGGPVIVPGGKPTPGKGGRWGKWLGRAAGILSLLGAGSDIMDSEADPSLSRRQKDTRAGGALGGAGGAIGGMTLGAAIGAKIGTIIAPGIGTAIGSAIGGAAGWFFGDQAGEILGKKLGEWVNDLRNANLPDKLLSAWNSALDWLKDKTGWNRIKRGAQALGENISEGARWLGDNTSLGRGAKRAWKGIKEGAGNAWGAVRNGAESLLSRPGRMDAGRQSFVDSIRQYAEATSARTGIPADILIAHAAQETGWGKSVHDNNYFNITGSYNGKSRVRGDSDSTGKKIKQSFRVYDNPQQSFDDLADLLSRRYPDALKARTALDYGTALKSGGYAADPVYAKHIAERYQEMRGRSWSSKSVLAAAESMIGLGEKNKAQAMTDYLNAYSGTTFRSIAGSVNAWCARFVSATLESQNIKSTKSASAASYLDYGSDVWNPSKGAAGLSSAQPGDIAVFKRKGGSGNHVAFVKSVNPATGEIEVVGGNQNDAVTVAKRSIAGLKTIRRAPSVPASIPSIPDAPTVTAPVLGVGTQTQQPAQVASGEAGQDLRDRRIAHIVTGGLTSL